MTILNKRDRREAALLIVIFIVLAGGLFALEAKVRHDLKTPFSYRLHVEGNEKDVAESLDGSVADEDEYVYVVDISKHWLNDPDGPLQTYGAQYDHTITNHTDSDIVRWSVIIEVPERNITIDSSWNGTWEYNKQESRIYFTPDELNQTIAAGASVGFGAVLISKELMNFSDVTVTGCRYRPITGYAAFWFLIILLVAWVTSAIAFVLYLLREENHRKSSERLNNVISQTMTTFVNFIDTKDRYTMGHSARVSYYSQKIAEKLGMSEEEVRDIGYIGLMHDCGKLAIPGNILNKPGTLTGEEFDIMRSHTVNGERMLKDFTAIDGIRDGALYHHERYDGTGYMKGLKGDEIPLVARIICVADALDAMNSDRVYRKHLSKEVILSELKNNRGTQFDPRIAQIMIDMIESGEVFVGDEDSKTGA